MNTLSITTYTPKSFVVRGVTPNDTRDHKDELKKLGGKFNAKLRSIDGDKYDPGWIFPLKYQNNVQAFIDKINDSIEEEQDEKYSDRDEDDSDYEDEDSDEDAQEDEDSDEDAQEDEDSDEDVQEDEDEEDEEDYKDSVENSDENSEYENEKNLPKVNSRRRKRNFIHSMTDGGLYPINFSSLHSKNYIEYNWIDNGPSKRHKSHHHHETMKLYKNSLFWWYYSCFLTFSTAFFIFYLFSTGTLLVSPYFRDFFLIRELGINEMIGLPGLKTDNIEHFSGDFWCNISRIFDVLT